MIREWLKEGGFEAPEAVVEYLEKRFDEEIGSLADNVVMVQLPAFKGRWIPMRLVAVQFLPGGKGGGRQVMFRTEHVREGMFGGGFVTPDQIHKMDHGKLAKLMDNQA